MSRGVLFFVFFVFFFVFFFFLFVFFFLFFFTCWAGDMARPLSSRDLAGCQHQRNGN